jgi:hypothetical protein
MADSTTYGRFAWIMQSPWAKGGAATKQWSGKMSISGMPLADTDAEVTGLDLWAPYRQLLEPNSSLIKMDYYAPGASVATLTYSYAPGAHPGNATGWNQEAWHQQLEVCAVARCPVGKSSTGKTVWLHKYIHDVQCGPANASQIAALFNETALLDPWNNGAGPNKNVPVDPTTGVAGGPWSIETAAYTRQLRRSAKHKIAVNPILAAPAQE